MIAFDVMYLTLYLTEPNIDMLEAALVNGYVEGAVIDVLSIYIPCPLKDFY